MDEPEYPQMILSIHMVDWDHYVVTAALSECDVRFVRKCHVSMSSDDVDTLATAILAFEHVVGWRDTYDLVMDVAPGCRRLALRLLTAMTDPAIGLAAVEEIPLHALAVEQARVSLPGDGPQPLRLPAPSIH